MGTRRFKNYTRLQIKIIMDTMSKDISEQVREYVYNNYKTYKNKDLIITEHTNHFSIRRHRDESPLVLGKGILSLI